MPRTWAAAVLVSLALAPQLSAGQTSGQAGQAANDEPCPDGQFVGPEWRPPARPTCRDCHELCGQNGASSNVRWQCRNICSPGQECLVRGGCRNCTEGEVDRDSDPLTQCMACPEGKSSEPGQTECSDPSLSQQLLDTLLRRSHLLHSLGERGVRLCELLQAHRRRRQLDRRCGVGRPEPRASPTTSRRATPRRSRRSCARVAADITPPSATRRRTDAGRPSDTVVRRREPSCAQCVVIAVHVLRHVRPYPCSISSRLPSCTHLYLKGECLCEEKWEVIWM